MKRLKSALVAFAAVLVAGIGVVATTQASCLSNDKANDIIECGFTTPADFAAKAKANAPGDLDTIFSHYGLSPSEYGTFAASAKAGKVSTNGNVTVDGKVVGTSAKSLGRKAKTKSTPMTIGGKTYHESSIGDVTTMDNDVTVLFDADGRVKIVIMNICGNPIRVSQKEKSAPAVDVTKTVDGEEKKTVNLDTEYSYVLNVKNTGNVELKDIAITDTPQSGITLVSSPVGSISNNTWKYTLPTLAVGESKEFKLTAKVVKYVSGDLKNTVCVDTPAISGGPDDCDDAYVNVPEPKKVQVCDIKSSKIITVDEADQNKDGYAPVDSEKCKIKVCDLDTKTVVTIQREAYNANKTRYTEDLAKCEPVTPTPTPTLPDTGPAETIASLAGVSSLAGAGYYWRASRRSLIESSLSK